MKEHPKYKIVCLWNCLEPNDDTKIQVQVCGTGRTFKKSASDLYSQEWLQDFSVEDIARIGAIMGRSQRSEDVLKKDAVRESYSTQFSIFIAGFIVALLVIANIGSAKIAHFNLGFLGSYHFPSSVIFFPFIFLLTDIGTELLGFKTCRKIIWVSFFSLALVIGALQITIALPASSHWLHQQAYALVVGQTPQIFIASSIAFLTGDLINAYILSSLKKLTSGRFFIFRALGSTFVGALVDSFIFINIAYWGKYGLDVMFNMIVTESFIKVTGEALVLPLTSLLLVYAKKFFNKTYNINLIPDLPSPNEQEIS